MAIAATLLTLLLAWIAMFPLRVILFTTMSMLLPSSTTATLLSSSSSSNVRGYSIKKLDGNSGGGGRGLERCLEDKIFSERILQKNTGVYFCQEIEVEENNLFRVFSPDQFHQFLSLNNLM